MKRSDIPVRAVLLAAKKFHTRPVGIHKSPEQALPYPEKVVLARMEQLVNRGLLEYGVSLRTAWVTEEGHKYLDGEDK